MREQVKLKVGLNLTIQVSSVRPGTVRDPGDSYEGVFTEVAAAVTVLAASIGAAYVNGFFDQSLSESNSCRCSIAMQLNLQEVENSDLQELEEVENSLSLPDLPFVVLYKILSYLPSSDLGRVAQVCKSLKEISGHASVWIKRLRSKSLINVHPKNHLATNKNNERFYTVPLKEQCRISNNWLHGRCRDVNLKKFGTNYMIPWLRLDNDVLYVAQGAVINGYNVAHHLHKKRASMRQPSVKLAGDRADLCKFVVRGDEVVAGCRNGVIHVWNKETGALSRSLSGCSDAALSVDMTSDITIAGTKDGCIKMWNRSSNECQRSLEVADRVLSLQISPCQSYFASGTAGMHMNENGTRHPLELWDLQSGQIIEPIGQNYRKGAGILDIQWETSHTLLACGYDSFIRMWDIRTSYQTPVQTFEEPDNYSFYCMQTDGKFLIASGSSCCGMARLWDKRKVDVLQNFYVGRNSRSSVYSLQFNTTHLYAVLNISLHALDFKI